tara:strand:- start:1400 stop:2299 length:900 start_codon:yes stop_codon:yes gene_type:complete
MGWGIFKNLKKIVKSVGKRIKKIGKGLKKIMTKIAKPFAKLGPLGSIALSMFIPWAAGAIWTGMTGTTLTLANFGAQAATNIASDSLFKKAIGYVMKGVHWGATKVKTAYQFVTDKISTGIDTLTGKAKDVLGIEADAGDLLADAVQNGPELGMNQTVDFSKNIATEAVAQPLGVQLDTSKAFVESAASEASGKVAEKAVEKSFFEKATDKAKESIIGAVGTNLDAALAPQEKVIDGGQAYESYNFLGDNTSYTTYNEQETALNNQGFSFGGPAYDANITTSGFGQDAYYSWFDTYKAR